MSEETKGDRSVRMLDEWMVGQIEELERSVRRLRLGLGVAVLAGLLWALVPPVLHAGREAGILPGSPYPTLVRADRFVLMDGDGGERGVWSVDDADNARFQLRDTDGVPRLRISVLESGSPGLSLTDERGRTRMVMALLPNENSSLAFADATGTTRVVLGVAPDDGATLVFADGHGETRSGLGVNAVGQPTFLLMEDADGSADGAPDGAPGAGGPAPGGTGPGR